MCTMLRYVVRREPRRKSPNRASAVLDRAPPGPHGLRDNLWLVCDLEAKVSCFDPPRSGECQAVREHSGVVGNDEFDRSAAHVGPAECNALHRRGRKAGNPASFRVDADRKPAPTSRRPAPLPDPSSDVFRLKLGRESDPLAAIRGRVHLGNDGPVQLGPRWTPVTAHVRRQATGVRRSDDRGAIGCVASAHQHPIAATVERRRLTLDHRHPLPRGALPILATSPR